MKKLAFTLMLLAGFGFMTQAQANEPWGFAIYDGTKEVQQFSVQNATLGSKVGQATCYTVLGLVNWGDCSIKAAMKNGRISRVTTADWQKKYIVVYGTKTLVVYGN